MTRRKVAAWAVSLLARPSVKDAVPASFREDYLAFIHRQGGYLSRLLPN